MRQLEQHWPGTCTCPPQPRQGMLKEAGVPLPQHKCPSLPDAATERGGLHRPRAPDTRCVCPAYHVGKLSHFSEPPRKVEIISQSAVKEAGTP